MYNTYNGEVSVISDRLSLKKFEISFWTRTAQIQKV